MSNNDNELIKDLFRFHGIEVETEVYLAKSKPKEKEKEKPKDDKS